MKFITLTYLLASAQAAGTVSKGGICRDATDCTEANSCCTSFNTSTSGAPNDRKVCFNPGTTTSDKTACDNACQIQLGLTSTDVNIFPIETCVDPNAPKPANGGTPQQSPLLWRKLGEKCQNL